MTSCGATVENKEAVSTDSASSASSGAINDKDAYSYEIKNVQGDFTLIGYRRVFSDGVGQMTTTDFDLQAGVITEEVVNYETDEVLSNRKTKHTITPLHTLQDFEPLNSEWY